MSGYLGGLWIGTTRTIDPSGNAQFASLNVTTSDSTLQNLYTANTNVQQRLSIGGITNSVTLNFGNGHGTCLNLQPTTITVTNTGVISDISCCYLASQPLQGNVSQTLGDLSTLYIPGSPSITSASRTGSNWSLKVASGNSYFGGGLTTVTASVTSTTDTSSAATGALLVAGGLGVAKGIHCDGTANLNAITSAGITCTGASSISGLFSSTNSTNATSTASGSIITTGGIGVTKDIYCGGTVTCNTLTTTNINFTGVLDLSGALRLQWAASSATAITLGSGDCYVECTASSNVTVTLPSLSGGIQGQIYVIQHSSDSAIQVTIVPNGSDRIGGVLNPTVILYSKYSAARLIAGLNSWISL